MGVILGILKIIILFGTLVTVHELGHFLVAKACNVKVHKFSIGFGSKIFTKKKGETEYSIRSIPFGGFVQLEGEDTRSDDVRAYNNKPVWQRMLIIVAGATVNIIVAVILYFGLSTSMNIYSTSIISDVENTSIAYQAGLRNGDKILMVNGKNVYFSSQVLSYISEIDDENVTFSVERDNSIIDIVVPIPKKNIGRIGVAFTNDGVVAYVEEGSIASNYDIKEGDKLISINEISDKNITELVEEIKNNANKEIKIVIERNSKSNTIIMIPEANTVKIFDVSFKVLSNLKFFDNLSYGLKETKYYLTETLKGFTRLFVGKAENASVMGPIGIAGEITKTESIAEFVYLMSAISLSLGICNLLPIPGLDGGKFLFLVIELIRKKPLEEKTEMALQLAGFAFIILVALIVTTKDVINIF